MTSEMKNLAIIGIATLGIIGVAIFFLNKSNPVGQRPETGKPVDQATLVKPDSYKTASDSAKVTVVEFLDYECEACFAAQPVIDRINEEYKDRVNFVVRNFPNHKNSILAAQFAEAAGEQGKFWEMHNRLFQSQKEWAEKDTSQRDTFLRYATELGLDTEKIKTGVDTNKYVEKINRDKNEGITIGVNATPTFYINGIQSVGVLSYEEFKKKIETELNK